MLANTSPAVTAAAWRLADAKVLAGFPAPGSPLHDWIGVLWVHQRSKNTLLLVPLVLGHKLGNTHAILNCLLGMVLMGLTASWTNMLNDSTDLRADRPHRTKRYRAIAAGWIAPLHALAGALALILMSLAGGVALSSIFALGLLGYVASSLTYSAVLKRVALLDTLTIGGLFTLPLVLGVELAGVPCSPWLMAFAGFFLFSCALAKRHGELLEATMSHDGDLARRGYEVDDWPLILWVGAASAMAALQILILCVENEVSPSRLYADPAWLYVAPAALAVWLVRVWMLSHRRLRRDDPIVFALHDPSIWALAASSASPPLRRVDPANAR